MLQNVEKAYHCPISSSGANICYFRHMYRISGRVLSNLFMSTTLLCFPARCFGSPWSLNLDFGRSALIFESIKPD